jgi:hypothetical protein
MDRHWTLDIVALSGIAAGFALFLTGETPLAGVVTAASAYAVLVPELADNRSEAPAKVRARTAVRAWQASKMGETAQKRDAAREVETGR